MKAFVPNVVALDYLNATKTLSPAKLEQGKKALITGVQQALETRITTGPKKGAFSIWSKKNLKDSDSVWLTAYVAKCFGKAKHLINIEDKNIFEALNFLKSQQEDSGKFKEYGRISYYNLQTDSSEGVPLTAFTVIAFLENKEYKDDFSDVIEKSLNYIDANILSLDDNYALAIASYALALGGKKDAANAALKTLTDNAFSEGGKMMYWEKNMTLTKSQNSTPEATKIEIAAYAILAHVKLEIPEQAVPIVNWLVSKRNSGGGFSSSHDTVIAIQALAEIATQLYSPKMDLNITLNLDDHKKIEFTLNDNNRLLRRNEIMAPSFRRLSLNASGEGIASVQVAYSYSKQLVDTIKIFDLNITEAKTSVENVMGKVICASYLPINTDGSEEFEDRVAKTGMALIEVHLPSGYIADPSFDILSFASVKVNCMKIYLHF